MRHPRHFFLGLIALLAAAPALAGKSADGLTFPEPTPAKTNAAGKPADEIPELPVVGKMLGRVPEEAFAGKEVYGRAKSAKIWDEAAAGFKGYGMTTEANVVLPWFVQAGVGDVITFDLTEGKVTRLCVWYKDLLPPKADTLRAQIRKATESKKPGDLRVNGIGIDLSVVRALKIGTSRSTDIIPMAVLILEINPVDWHLAHYDATEPVKTAMYAGKLLEGMSEKEARLALRKYEVKEENIDGGKQLSWFAITFKEVKAPREPTDAPNVIRLKNEKVETLKFKGKFVNDKLVEIKTS